MRREKNLLLDDIAIILGLSRGFIGQIESPIDRGHINCLSDVDIYLIFIQILYE